MHVSERQYINFGTASNTLERQTFFSERQFKILLAAPQLCISTKYALPLKKKLVTLQFHILTHSVPIRRSKSLTHDEIDGRKVYLTQVIMPEFSLAHNAKQLDCIYFTQ